MRNYFFIFVLFFSLSTFGKDGKISDFLQCKREVSEYRSDYASIHRGYKHLGLTIVGLPDYKLLVYKFRGKSHVTKFASPFAFHRTINIITSTPFFIASLNAALYVGSIFDA